MFSTQQLKYVWNNVIQILHNKGKMIIAEQNDIRVLLITSSSGSSD